MEVDGLTYTTVSLFFCHRWCSIEENFYKLFCLEIVKFAECTSLEILFSYQ